MSDKVISDGIRDGYMRRAQQIESLSHAVEVLADTYRVMHHSFRQGKVGDAMNIIENALGDIRREQINTEAEYPELAATQSSNVDLANEVYR